MEYARLLSVNAEGPALPEALSFACSLLIIEFKGILMKLKNVALAISVEKFIFLRFYC